MVKTRLMNFPSGLAYKPTLKISFACSSVSSPSANNDGVALLSERRATPLKKVKKKRQLSTIARPVRSSRLCSASRASAVDERAANWMTSR